MPTFPGAQNFVINNSQFTDNSSNGPSGIDILLGASNPDAAYDSGARTEAPFCFPGTREQFIEDIVHWAIPAVHESPLPLSWMKGAGGVGKSAVAQTSAEQIGKSGALGAAYFFSINGRTKHDTFFPSIAYQLSMGFPDYGEVVERNVRRDKTLVKKTMASQFQRLIVDPFVVGKAGEEHWEEASAREGTTPLCWAFFSRPEPHIEATFARHDVADLCHKTILPVSHDADSDIELYLRSSFNNLLQLRNLSSESPWPSDSDMKTIVKASKGLFIYAATIYRFIAQPDWLSLDEPLNTVLATISEVAENDHSSSTPTSPFAELDAFYLLIMRRIPNRMLPSIWLFLAYLYHYGSGYGPIYIANILGLSKAELLRICAQLNAVVRFHEERRPLDRPTHEMPEPARIFGELHHQVYFLGGVVDFYHKSFRDFLRDPDRSGDFCVATSASKELLFETLLKQRVDLQHSFHIQNSELVVAPNVPNSASSLSYPAENEIVNSVIKVVAYDRAIYICDSFLRLPGVGLSLRQKLVACDFRKELHIQASKLQGLPIYADIVHGQYGLCKYINSTKLFRSDVDGGSELDTDTFSNHVLGLKRDIENDEEAGLIQRYPPELGLSSELKSLLDGKSGEMVESGLYVVGCGEKAIFWLWEVNHDKGSYREFRSADLEEGARIYRAEPFDSWKRS